MARARNIKPGLYKNEDLAECSIWARYVFAGLSTISDREGRLEDRPKRIKGELLPYDAQDMEPLLKELTARGFIQRYEVAGVRYIQILTFNRHQSPHYSEKPSVIPPPNSESRCVIKEGPQPPDSPIPDSPIPDSLQKPAAGAARRPPANGHKVEFSFESGKFVGITDADELRWQKAYPAIAVPVEVDKAAAWMKANPSNRKKNYERFLVNWFGRAQERAPRVGR